MVHSRDFLNDFRLHFLPSLFCLKRISTIQREKDNLEREGTISTYSLALWIWREIKETRGVLPLWVHGLVKILWMCVYRWVLFVVFVGDVYKPHRTHVSLKFKKCSFKQTNQSPWEKQVVLYKQFWPRVNCHIPPKHKKCFFLVEACVSLSPSSTVFQKNTTK